MATSLNLSHKAGSKMLAGKIFLLVTAILFCISGDLSAGVKPAISYRGPKTAANRKSWNAPVFTANKSDKAAGAKTSAILAPPTISYPASQTCTAGTAITPLKPVGSGVSAARKVETAV